LRWNTMRNICSNGLKTREITNMSPRIVGFALFGWHSAINYRHITPTVILLN
jgi:hypothetical protein